MDLVASGGIQSLGALGSYEPHFAEGDRGELHVQLRLVPPGLVAAVNVALKVRGLAPLAYTAPGRVLVVPFRKGVAPLVIIAAALAAVLVVAGLVVAWKLFRLSPAAVGLGLGVLIVAGLMLFSGGPHVKRE